MPPSWPLPLGSPRTSGHLRNKYFFHTSASVRAVQRRVMQNGATGGSLQTTYLNLLRSSFLACESGHNETSRFGGGNASDAVVGTRKVPSVPVFEHLVFSRWRCFFWGEGLCNLQEAEPSWRNWGGLRGFTAWRDFFPSMYGF